jgi:hypothetical protein
MKNEEQFLYTPFSWNGEGQRHFLCLLVELVLASVNSITPPAVTIFKGKKLCILEVCFIIIIIIILS